MLPALRHDALVGCHHEEDEVDAGRAGDHGAHEPFVSGHVHDPETPTGWKIERREAQLDRDSAGFLLRQAIALHSGQGSNEGGLAVIDVPRGTEDEPLCHPILSKPA